MKYKASEISSSTPKREYCHETHNEELRDRIKNDTYDKVYAVSLKDLEKMKDHQSLKLVKEEWIANLSEEEIENYDSNHIGIYYHNVEKEAVRTLVLNEGKNWMVEKQVKLDQFGVK